MSSQNIPSLDTSMELNNEESASESKALSEYDSCDFCINCNTVLLQESDKISKIFRLVPLNPITPLSSSSSSVIATTTMSTDKAKIKTEVSLVSAISLAFNLEGRMDPVTSEPDKYIVCVKCGKLLELAYNAILDFMELTRRGSALQDKLLRTNNRQLKKLSPALKKNKKVASSKKNTEVLNVTPTRSQRLMKGSGGKDEENVTRRKSEATQITDGDDKPKAKYNCGLCGKSFISGALLGKHKRLFHKNINEPKSFPRKSLRRCARQSGEIIKNEQVLTDSIDATDLSMALYYCSTCDMEFEQVDNFQSHLKLHEEEDENNDSNRSSYHATTIATEDIDYDDDDDGADCDLSLEKLKCKLCGEEGNNSVSELKEHYSKQHPLVSILTVNDMNNIETSGKEDEFNDPLENNDVSEKSKSLSGKTGGNNGRFIFNCNVCHKRFIRHDHIKLHLRIHTGEKPFICNVEGCGKTFSDPRGLAYHEITHSNERPYCCKFCGMTFKRLHHLNDHERNHNDIPRRFICQFCEKGFKHRKHLNSHLIVHQGTKEHQCNLCFKSFNRKDNLRQHVRKVHGKQSDAPNDNNRKPSPTKDAIKHEKPALKLVGGEAVTNGGHLTSSTSSTQTVVFHTPTGAISSGTIISTSANASPDSNSSPTPSSSVVMPTAAVKGSVANSTATTLPVTIAITDQTAIDHIVYMHL